jgi:hypothetical protein
MAGMKTALPWLLPISRMRFSGDKLTGPAQNPGGDSTGKLSPTLERKVQLGFALAIMAMAMGVLAYRSVVQRRADAAWVDHTHQVISALCEEMSTVTDAETGGRGFVIRYAGQRTFGVTVDSGLDDAECRRSRWAPRCKEIPVES